MKRTLVHLRSSRVGTIAVALSLLVGLFALPASAAHYQASLEGSKFQIENNANIPYDNDASTLATRTTSDWGNVPEDKQGDAATGQNDDSYVGGVKEDTSCPGQGTGSIPNNKSDLLSFGVYHEPGSTVGDDGFLHLFWTRVSDPSGTTLMDFEFNQSQTGCPAAGGSPNVVRTTDDMLIEYALESGGSRATITIRRWTGSAWGPARTFNTAANEAVGTTNTSSITAANSDGILPPGTTTQARTFGEASINMNLVFDDTSCQSFGSAMLKSRSSTSFTSQLKDFIEPLPITLTNCGSLDILKTAAGGGTLAGAKFKVYEDKPVLNTFASPPDTQVGSECTTTANGIGDCVFTNLLIGKSFWVVETQAPTGYIADTTPRLVTITSTTRVTSGPWVNQPALGDLTVTKTDDAGNLINGVTFTLTGTATGGASVNESCVTGTSNNTGTTVPPDGKCSILNVPIGDDYTLAESNVPAGYGLDPDFPLENVAITSSTTTLVAAENPRLHKVIVVVCHQGTNTLAPSDVTLGTDNLTTIGTPPTIGGATAAQVQAALCAMQGFGGKAHGNVSPTVDVGSDAHQP
jgi:Prealbumin-like fold domain